MPQNINNISATLSQAGHTCWYTCKHISKICLGNYKVCHAANILCMQVESELCIIK